MHILEGKKFGGCYQICLDLDIYSITRLQRLRITLPQTVKNTNQFCCSYFYQQQKVTHTSIYVGISRCLHCVDRVNTEIKIGSKI